MANSVHSWPDWGKSATKGDVLKTLVALHGGLIDTLTAIDALNARDEISLEASADAIRARLKVIQDTISEIGGSNV